LRVNVETSSLALNGDTLRQQEGGTINAFGTMCVYNTNATLTRVSTPSP
jgi:hypothetical protein